MIMDHPSSVELPWYFDQLRFYTLRVFDSNKNNTVAVKYRKYSLYDFLQGT